MILQGSYPLYSEFFAAHEHEAPPGGWEWKDSYHFTESQLKWFYDRGCEWKKVEANAGDVILWDSRLIHYGAAAEGDRPRVATCECQCVEAEGQV
jgi:ectoine hydroxylase-related dioxygenase (phytanoyl-CoA dioxygenase family)